MSSRAWCTKENGGRESPCKGPQRPLVLLQFSPEDEHAVAVRPRAQLLHAAHGFEPLWTTTLCDDDVDFKTVTDLQGKETKISKGSDMISFSGRDVLEGVLLTKIEEVAPSRREGRVPRCDALLHS